MLIHFFVVFEDRQKTSKKVPQEKFYLRPSQDEHCLTWFIVSLDESGFHISSRPALPNLKVLEIFPSAFAILVLVRRCPPLVCDNSDGTRSNENKVPDESTLDVYGNALMCKCAEGYSITAVSCSDGALRSGACAGASRQPKSEDAQIAQLLVQMWCSSLH